MSRGQKMGVPPFSSETWFLNSPTPGGADQITFGGSKKIQSHKDGGLITIKPHNQDFLQT